MNRLFQWSWRILVCFLFVGCSSAPTTDIDNTEPAENLSTLTPVEKKSYEQALSQLTAGKYGNAEKLLEKLARNHSGNIGLWVNLANAYYQNNNLSDANNAVNHAQKLNPKTPDFYNIAGLVTAANGDYKGAEKQYLAALKINNNEPNVHYNLALLYDVFYQDIARAITHYEQYLALGNQDDEETVNWLEELKLTLDRSESQ